LYNTVFSQYEWCWPKLYSACPVWLACAPLRSTHVRAPLMTHRGGDPPAVWVCGGGFRFCLAHFAFFLMVVCQLAGTCKLCCFLSVLVPRVVNRMRFDLH
jgi:hypothetical protein